MENAYIAAVMSMLLPMPITMWRPSVTAFPTCKQTDVHFTYEPMVVSKCCIGVDTPSLYANEKSMQDRVGLKAAGK